MDSGFGTETLPGLLKPLGSEDVISDCLDAVLDRDTQVAEHNTIFDQIKRGDMELDEENDPFQPILDHVKKSDQFIQTQLNSVRKTAESFIQSLKNLKSMSTAMTSLNRLSKHIFGPEALQIPEQVIQVYLAQESSEFVPRVTYSRIVNESQALVKILAANMAQADPALDEDEGLSGSIPRRKQTQPYPFELRFNKQSDKQGHEIAVANRDVLRKLIALFSIVPKSKEDVHPKPSRPSRPSKSPVPQTFADKLGFFESLSQQPQDQVTDEESGVDTDGASSDLEISERELVSESELSESGSLAWDSYTSDENLSWDDALGSDRSQGGVPKRTKKYRKTERDLERETETEIETVEQPVKSKPNRPEVDTDVASSDAEISGWETVDEASEPVARNERPKQRRKKEVGMDME